MSGAEPTNGRQIRKGDPLVTRILAIVEESRASGLPYPRRVVDDLYKERFVRWGGVTYDATDCTRLVLSHEARMRPIVLPDHFVIDGSERLPGETQAQYAKYLAYRDLGPARTLGQYDKLAGHSGTVSEVAARLRWRERAALWDAKIEGEMRATAERLMRERMEGEVQRRSDYLDSEWEVVVKGFHVLNEMLKYPVIEQESVKTSADGKTIVTVWKPGKWTYSAMAQLIEVLTKIARLHTGLSTSNASQRRETALGDGGEANVASMSADDLAMHQFASQKAEAAYFEACDEWRTNRQTPIKAMVAA